MNKILRERPRYSALQSFHYLLQLEEEGPETCRNFLGPEQSNNDFATVSVLSHLAHGTCMEDLTQPLPRLVLGIRIEIYK